LVAPLAITLTLAAGLLMIEFRNNSDFYGTSFAAAVNPPSRGRRIISYEHPQ
jgi:hypothetical protein